MAWMTHKTSSTQLDEMYEAFEIHSHDLDGNDCVLFVCPGFSNEACEATKNIINDKLDSIRNKYKKVFVINLFPLKKFQKISDATDTISTAIERHDKWAADIAMKATHSSVVDKIIRAICNDMNISNVHLLGKSAGGGLAMNIVTRNTIYKKLYLAVPAHPLFCKPLIEGNIYDKLMVVVGWNYNDEYNLYDIKSNKQMPYYEDVFIQIKNKYPNFNYVQCLFSPGNKHEVNPNLLDL